MRLYRLLRRFQFDDRSAERRTTAAGGRRPFTNHEKSVVMHLVNEGYLSHQAIANRMGCSRQAVSQLVKRIRAKHAAKKARQDAWRRMRLVKSLPVNVMLRGLLMDRLKLRAHRDTRAQPVYALVVANADAKLGPHLHSTAVDCLALARQRTDSSSSTANPCRGRYGTGSFSMCCPNMPTIASMLSGTVQRLVVDRTGLLGNFDMDLQWATLATAADASSPDAPSIFTAVQEQLGLKLQPTTAPVDVLVIDHIEHPSED